MIREVKTENGMVQGLPAADPRITSFKGIPFAAPPVGENRWRAPQPCADWEGTLLAHEFAPISVQDTPGLGTDIYCREWHVDPDIPMGEDCLYLNVWTGAKKTDEKQPVLVWFFGGALQWGYPSEMEFDGERLARRGIVVVTVNYRLGAFGFLAHPDLSATQPEAPANFGNLDQQAGLRWVIRNIEAFGGDPKNITIAGQSAGAGSVLTQLTSPTNQDAFQKAVVMSGMIRSPYMVDSFFIPKTLQKAEEMGKAFIESLGVKTIEEARKLDAIFIRDEYAKFRATHGMFATVQDGVFSVGEPLKLIAEDKYLKVPIMAGNTADEFPSFLPAANDEEFRAKAKEIFGDKVDQFLSFGEAWKKLGENQYAPVGGLECTVKGVFTTIEELGGKDCYYYRFAPDIPGWDNPGTFHSVDLWFFFETLSKCWRPFVGRHYDLARQMCNYWANFIKTGDPNGEDIDGSQMPVWERFTKDNHAEMVFTAEGAKPGVENSNYIQFMSECIRENI